MVETLRQKIVVEEVVCFIMIKCLSHLDDKTIVNLYVPNNKDRKYDSKE